VINPTDYIPHGLVAALGAVVAYMYKDHVKRDDSRFEKADKDMAELGAKIDRHYEQITMLLTTRLPPQPKS
jgi:hypothetical protein